MFNWINSICNELMVEFSDSLDIPEQPFRYNLFYKDDLTTYSTIEIEYKFRWNKLRIAISRFIEKYPFPKITNIIHIIERNRDNEPICYKELEYKKISKKSFKKYKELPIESFYYNYPQLADNYLVHLIKDCNTYVKYFNNIYDAYEFMKKEFYNFCNREGGSNVSDYITSQHELAFGHIQCKYVDEYIDVYSQNPTKSKNDIKQLFDNGHLYNGLTFNLSNRIEPDDFYFDIKLISNNKNKNVWGSCIICNNNNGVQGSGDVFIYNCDNDKYFTKNGDFDYCEKHDPFPSRLDD